MTWCGDDAPFWLSSQSLSRNKRRHSARCKHWQTIRLVVKQIKELKQGRRGVGRFTERSNDTCKGNKNEQICAHNANTRLLNQCRRACERDIRNRDGSGIGMTVTLNRNNRTFLIQLRTVWNVVENGGQEERANQKRYPSRVFESRFQSVPLFTLQRGLQRKRRGTVAFKEDFANT